MVHWVVNTNLKRETGYVGLVEALQRLDVPYTLVDKPPFVDYLIDSNREFGEEPKIITLDLEGPVFVTGTTSMREVSRKHGWNPGYIDAPGQTELMEHWGDHLLNSDAVFGPLRDIQVPGAHFFARPVEDTKAFAGTTFDAAEFEEWRKVVVEGSNDFVTLNGDDQVMLAPLKNIFSEYRLYFIDGQYATGSRYKRGSVVSYDPFVEPEVIAYARERISEFCPRIAVCLDIAHIEGDEPYKVIETNAISSAGFYACDMNVFVGAMNVAIEDEYLDAN
jgi:hypothetical protein